VRRLIACLCLIVAASAVAACGRGSASADDSFLPGTNWTVSSIGGVGAVGGSEPTIAFKADRTVDGTTGCNHYFGTYKLDGGAITVSPLGSTLMLCQGPIGAQETAFMTAFPKSTGWSVASDGKLTLTGAADIVATP